jgi:hypothetical protein
MAYWIQDNKCKYSFDSATFSGLEGEFTDENGDKNIGFKLSYESKEDCIGSDGST